MLRMTEQLPINPSPEVEYDEDDIRATCNEAFTVEVFVRAWKRGECREQLPWSDPDTDTMVREQAFKFGRADIVLYHADGTATVIEAKDGINGYQHVASAIGQASLYATQVAAKGAVTRCRRAVLWSALPKQEQNELMVKVCTEAGVTPIHMGDHRLHLKLRLHLRRLLAAWEINSTPSTFRKAAAEELFEIWERP
jgi:hypothetical protein